MFWIGSIVSSFVSAFSQRSLEKVRTKAQIANSIRQYKLTNTWPLDTAPEEIAQMIQDMPGNIPVYLVIAPVSANSEFQKALSDVWSDIANFFTSAFRVNSESPVIIGKYKEKATNGMPGHDYMTIFNGLKSVPTFYLAPFSTMKDSILGITIAFWGTNDTQTLPVVQNIELDIKKLYIDEIRKEAADFVKRCKQGMLNANDYPNLKNNVMIFQSERAMLAAGNDFVYLDKTLNFYKNLVPSSSVFISLIKQIIPVIKLFSSYIIDTYFVLRYNTLPVFPAIISDISQTNLLPELYMRGFEGENDSFRLWEGKRFLNEIFASYTNIVAENIPPLCGIKYIPRFQNVIEDGKNNFEEILVEKYLPASKSVVDYSEEQNQLMHEIARLPEIKNSVRLSDLLVEWKKNKSECINNDVHPVIIESFDEMYRQAKICMQNAQITEAVKLFEIVAPRIPQAAYDLGEIYYTGTYCSKNYILAAKYFELAHKGGIKAYVKLAVCKREAGCSQQEYRSILYDGVNSGDDASACKLAIEYIKEKDILTAKNLLAVPLKNNSREARELLGELMTDCVGSFVSEGKKLFSFWKK